MVSANSSARAFVCGWCGDVKNCLMLNAWQKALASLDIKAAPLSVRSDIPLGSPNRATILSKMADATVSAVQSFVGMSSGHIDVESIMHSIYLNPQDSENGP